MGRELTMHNAGGYTNGKKLEEPAGPQSAASSTASYKGQKLPALFSQTTFPESGKPQLFLLTKASRIINQPHYIMNWSSHSKIFKFDSV